MSVSGDAVTRMTDELATWMTNESEQRLKPTKQVKLVAWSDANLKEAVLVRCVVKLVCVVKGLSRSFLRSKVIGVQDCA